MSRLERGVRWGGLAPNPTGPSFQAQIDLEEFVYIRVFLLLIFSIYRAYGNIEILCQEVTQARVS